MDLDCALVIAWLDFIADIMLAVAALYVTGQALRGWRKEAQAEALPSDSETAREKKAEKIADAKTFYAMASLSKVWVLLLIFIATLIKVGLGLSQAPWNG